jgi:hypothetical protein
MHSYTHNLLPISFNHMWTLNRKRNPDRIFRNADQLYVRPHNYATLKRMPLFNFPYTWNQGVEKFNPIQHRYLKNLKAQFIHNL